MKKKLNLFCILIFAVVACEILLMLNVMFTGIVSGYNSAEEMMKSPKGEEYSYHTVSVLPVEMTDRTAQTLTDGKAENTYKAWPTHLFVVTDGSEITVSNAMSIATGIVSIALVVVVVVSFIGFVRNVNRSYMFTKKNTAHLRRIGWSLTIAGIVSTINGCCETYAAQQAFKLEGYVIDYSEAVHLEMIIFGLFSLVIAEAFAIGLKMKEEQELTI